MWKLNNILLSAYGIIPGQVDNEGIAVKGIFDLPKRLGKTFKDWDDFNSVEPYVEDDEIFLKGRDIMFQGILTGTKAETEANIELLKSAIGNFINVVPFETPYGSYCVYIKQITPKIYNGVATVLIEMREPVVGATCSVSGTVTTYLSTEVSGSTDKNDCEAGYFGSTVTLTAAAGMFTSPFSVADATAIAEEWVRVTKQLYANGSTDGVPNGTCTVNPPIYYNAALTNSLQKDDCASGYVGSLVSYTIAADIYSSDTQIDPTASQAKADAKAQAAMDLILTQAYANEKGTCSNGPTFFLKLTMPIYTVFWLGQYYVGNYFEVGEVMVPGTIYNFIMYGVKISYTSVSDDTPTSIINSLTTAINNTTVTQWDAHNQYLLFAEKPYGYLVGSNVLFVAGYCTVSIQFVS